MASTSAVLLDGLKGYLFRLCFALLTLALAGSPSLYSQTAYYVSQNGDDHSPGTEALPFRTIAKGLSALNPGGTLFIKAGTYYEGLDENVPTGTSWDAPVTVRNYPGDAVTLLPSGGNRVFGITGPRCYIIIQGLTLDGTNVAYEAVKLQPSGSGDPSDYSNYPHDIRLLDCEIMHSPGSGVLTSRSVNFIELRGCNIHDNGQTDFDHGVYFKGAYCTIDNCLVHDNAGWGVHFYTSDYSDSVHHGTVSNNLIYHNAAAGGRGAGIGFYGPHHVAYNNVIWGNATGIELDYGAEFCELFNNTVTGNEREGLTIGADLGTSAPQNGDYTTVRNNIFYGNGGGVIDRSTGSKYDHNLLSDPGFVDASANDFHLLPGGAAVDAGTPVWLFQTDREGKSRPLGNGWDIGAYEYGESPLAPPAPRSPTSGSVNVPTSPILTWDASSGASSYRLQVAVTSDFSSVVVDQGNLEQTSLSVTGLEGSQEYYWRVSSGNTDRSSEWSQTWTFVTGTVVTLGPVPPVVPTTFSLAQNYPNPFNPSTTIEFALPETSPVSLEVYDILGSRVRTLVDNQVMSAAFHTVSWNGTNDNGSRVSSGLYVCFMRAKNFVASKKMLLID